jgi:hypothetical protein
MTSTTTASPTTKATGTARVPGIPDERYGFECALRAASRGVVAPWGHTEAMKASAALAARERTAAEYRDLLERAGLRLARVVQTASPFSLIEAKPS